MQHEGTRSTVIQWPRGDRLCVAADGSGLELGLPAPRTRARTGRLPVSVSARHSRVHTRLAAWACGCHDNRSGLVLLAGDAPGWSRSPGPGVWWRPRQVHGGQLPWQHPSQADLGNTQGPRWPGAGSHFHCRFRQSLLQTQEQRGGSPPPPPLQAGTGRKPGPRTWAGGRARGSWAGRHQQRRW